MGRKRLNPKLHPSNSNFFKIQKADCTIGFLKKYSFNSKS